MDNKLRELKDLRDQTCHQECLDIPQLVCQISFFFLFLFFTRFYPSRNTKQRILTYLKYAINPYSVVATMYISSVSDIVSEHSGSEIKGAMEKVQTKTEQPL